MTEKTENPYVGPNPFPTDKRDLFFGREREARDLLALVVSEQLVLFYAQSGAGKSSLINTRLIPSLQQKHYEVLHVGRVGGSDTDSAFEADNIYVANLIRSLVERDIESATLCTLSLGEFLAKLNRDENGYFYDTTRSEDQKHKNERRALIVDQFEELFSMYPEAWEQRRDFFLQLAQAMQNDPYLWVVFVMREDYIASLDPYARLLPGRLRTRFYMQRLESKQAIEAVEGPVQKYNRSYEKGAASQLVDELSHIMVRKPDNTWEPQTGQYVEPVQLQVVCSSLWEKLPDEVTTITTADIEKYVGNLNQALGNFYGDRVQAVAGGRKAREKGVKERDIRRWFEKELIIDGKRRNMVAQEPGGRSGGLDDDIVREFLGSLVREEKRGGGATFYELTHDRMVEPIIENNRTWDQKNSSPFRSHVDEWEKSGKKEFYLIGGQVLSNSKRWAEENPDKLTVSESQFLEASQARQQTLERERELQRQRETQEQELRRQKEEQEALLRQKELEAAQQVAKEQTRSAQKARIYTLISLGFAILAIVATVFAFSQLSVANQQTSVALTAEADAIKSETDAKTQADIAKANELSTIALERSGSQLDLAILLGLQADSIKRNDRTQNTLLALAQKASRYNGFVPREDKIEDIQYSPNGKIFALRDKRGITFWDASTLEQVKPIVLNGHFSNVTAMASTSDGARFATGAANGTIVLWDAAQRKPLSSPIHAQQGPVTSLAFNADGTMLASASSSENPIYLWNVREPSNPRMSGSPLTNQGASISSIAFNADGSILASGSYNQSITLWNVSTHRQVGPPLTAWVNELTFNRAGTLLVSAGDDNKVVLWSLDPKDATNIKKTGELSKEGFTYIRSVAISPDGQWLAAGNFYGEILLWDISNLSDPGKLQPKGDSYNQNASGISKIIFSPGGDLLASSSSSSGGAILWDIKDPSSPRKLSEVEPNSGVSSVTFANNGQSLITGGSGPAIKYWDIGQPRSPRKDGDPLQGHIGQPTSMQFSPDGRLLASNGDDGTILLDVQKLEPLGPGYFYTSENGEILAYQIMDPESKENTIYLRNAISGQPIGDPIPGQYPTLSPDGKTLTFLTYEKTGSSTMHVWNIPAKQPLLSVPSGYSAFFSPDGQILVYQTSDPSTNQNYLNLWSVPLAKPIAEKISGTFPRFSPDSRILAYQTTGGPGPQSQFIIPTNSSISLSFNLMDAATGTTILNNIPGSVLSFSSNSQNVIYQSNGSKGESQTNLLRIDKTNQKALQPKTFTTSSSIVSTSGAVLAFITYEETGSLVNVINADTGEPLQKPFAGNAIISLSNNGSILIYSTLAQNNVPASMITTNTKTGQILLSIPATGANPGSEAGSTRVQEFYDYTTGKNSIAIFDTESGQTVMGPIDGNFLYLSQDGKLVVYQTVGNEGYSVNLFDVSNKVNIGAPILGNFRAVSRDGKTLVTNSEDHIAIFWNIQRTWPFGQRIKNMPDKVVTATVSQDGSTLAWVDDQGVSLRNLATNAAVGEPFMNNRGSLDSISVSMNPNGKMLAIDNYQDQTVTLWNIQKGEAIDPSIPGNFAIFSPDGKTFTTVDQQGSQITIWDLTNMNHPVAVSDPMPGFISSYSPDSRLLVIGGDNESEKLKIWDVAARKIINDSIPGVYATFNADNTLLAVLGGSGDNSEDEISIWDAASFKKVGKPFQGGFASFSPDGKSIAVGGQDGVTTLWDLEKHEPVGDPIEGGFPIKFSPDGSILVLLGADQQTIFIWDLNAHKQIRDAITGDSSSGGLDFDVPYKGISSDGKVYAFLDSERKVLLWDAGSDTYLTPPEYPGQVLGVNLNQNGPFFVQNLLAPAPDFDILALYGNQGLMLYDLRQKKPLGDLIPLGSIVPATNISLSPNGKLIATFAEDSIVLRDTVANVDRALSYSGSLTANMAFNEDSSRLTALASDNTLVSWDVKSGKLIDVDTQPLVGLSLINPVFSPSGEQLAYEINNINSTSLGILDLPLDNSHAEKSFTLTNSGGAIAFSPDGSLVAYNDGDVIKLYNLAAQQPVGEIQTSAKVITSLGIILDAKGGPKYILSADSSGSTQIWDWGTRTKIGDSISGTLRLIGMNSSDHSVVYMDPSGKMIHWKWDLLPSEWEALLCPIAKRPLFRTEWDLYLRDVQYPGDHNLICSGS